MSLVRERGVTVLLDGQGSDELLAGYRPYYAYLSDFVRRGQFRRLISEAFAARERTGALVVRLLIGAVSYWVISTVRPHLPSMWTQWVRKLRARPGATTRVLRPQFRRDHRAALPPPIPHAGNGFLDSIMREALTETSLPYLLHYEDRSSMAFGVEARVPFLDYRLVEFVFKHGFPYRINHGWTKWILREAMRDIVPSAIAWRRDKVGFETPEATWIRQWLDAHPDFFGHDALLSRYVDLDAVNREVDSWKARGGNIADARRIWRLVNLELWLKVWRERGVNVDPVELAHAG